MMEQIKINPKWDLLAQRAAEARNAGMSYGKYVAMEYERRMAQKEADRIAAERRKEEAKLQMRKADLKRIEEAKKKAEEELQAVIQKREVRCLYCGRKFKPEGVKIAYCSDECRFSAHRTRVLRGIEHESLE